MGANKSCSTGNNNSQGIKPPGQVFFQRRNELDPTTRIPYSLLDAIPASWHVYGPWRLRPLLFVRIFTARILIHQTIWGYNGNKTCSAFTGKSM